MGLLSGNPVGGGGSSFSSLSEDADGHLTHQPSADATDTFNFNTSGGTTVARIDTTNQHLAVLGAISDANDNEVLGLSPNASAVNHLQVANAASGNKPTLSAVGGDADVGIIYSAKATGVHEFQGQGNPLMRFNNTAGGVANLRIQSSGNDELILEGGGLSNDVLQSRNNHLQLIAANALKFQSGGTNEAARFDTNQNLLIGKTTHAADLLEAAGTIRAEGGTRSASPTIADDAVSTVTPDRSRVKVHVYDGSGESGEATLDVSSGTVVNTNYSSANLAFTTGSLGGTTGTDGNLTVSADGTNGTIDIENRTGASKTVTLTIIG